MSRANTAETLDEATQEAAEKRLALDGYPLLQALLRGPDGEALRDELLRLVHREPRRAQRFQRDLFARIRSEPDGPPEIAIVRDISQSGVRLELSASAHLDVMHTRSVFIEMRLPRAPFVTCEATLVRVVEHHQNGVELAFTFVRPAGSDPAFEALLAQLASTVPKTPQP